MKVLYTVFLLFFFLRVTAQITDTVPEKLAAVTVRAFEQSRLLKNVPGAISYINREGLDRFGAATVVHAVNTLPGVRMEERSPGSYRMNIRGSSLRSPFGVRNVKVYFNGLPFTDPGGQTYLNGLGAYNFQSIEIIKGPGSSLYGAGTGGVLLIEGMDANERAGGFAEYSRGSFGLQNVFTSVTTASESSKNKIGFQHQHSEGYRYHSQLKRNILSWNGYFGNTEKSRLKTTFLFTDLFYETPGALTRTEFSNNPKRARPAAGGFPSSEGAKASIYQKTFLAGLNYHRQFTSRVANNSTAYGSFTELQNPAIRNYGKNSEPHAGGRTVFTYEINNFRLVAGGEFQQSFNTISVHGNRNGSRDTLQSLDDVSIRQSLAFLQASFQRNGWELVAGASLNFQRIRIQRNYPEPITDQTRNINNEFAPRIALSKSWNAITVYTSVSRGFSPPSSAELLPSGSSINLSLNPEEGTNYDVGARGRISNFSFDVNAFLFSLQNTIVQRRDAGGGDFFINAGKTRQYGIETSLSYPLQQFLPFFRQGIFWIGHTFHHFRYEEFRQLNNDFSGKRLPGIAPHTLSSGIDLTTRNGLLANVSYYFSDRLPLNDANTDYANAYHLLHARIGFEKWMLPSWRARIILGAENLFDQTYSLGNDINGFGGRYFNAAPGRSFYLSFQFQFHTGNKE